MKNSLGWILLLCHYGDGVVDESFASFRATTLFYVFITLSSSLVAELALLLCAAAYFSFLRMPFKKKINILENVHNKMFAVAFY